MSYCLNPNCSKPHNPSGHQFCLTCGTKLLLKDRYRATDFLGAGGMGRNLLAVDEDTPSKKRCVIKQFSPHSNIASNPAAFQKAVELFNREAAQLDQLGDESSQIPRLLAHLEQDKRLYFVQEFIDGQNLLKELEQEGNYSETQIYLLLADLLAVLKFIHQQGVLHRDIKPENIMRRYRDNQLVLIDFGISRQWSGTVMSMGTTAGTLGYAPPEQMTYGEAYPASDLYALGATCIHLLTGIEPHQLYNPLENRWLWQDVLQQRRIAVSSQLEQVLEKMLKADVRERYQSVDEVLKVLNPQKTQAQASAEDYYKQGLEKGKRGNYKQAIEDFTQALRFNPNSAPTHKYRGLAYSRLGQHQAALEDFQQAAKLYSQQGEIDDYQDILERLRKLQLQTPEPQNPNWQCTHTLNLTYGSNFIAFSPGGRILATASIGEIKLWDVSTGQELRTLKGYEPFEPFAISPDGQVLVSVGVTSFGMAIIKLWQIDTGRKLCSFETNASLAKSIAFSPDGQTLAIGGKGVFMGFGTIELWKLNTEQGKPQRLSTLSDLFSKEVNFVTFSPDAQFVASVDGDRTVKLWRVSDGQVIFTFKGSSSSSVVFSPDGQILASGSFQGTIKLWRVSDGQVIGTLTGHTGWVSCVAISPDGQIIASSGSSDNTIKLWQLRDKQEICTIMGHSTSILSIAFSQNGQTLATLASGSSDKTIKIWKWL
jgi:WD40 repeat protein